MGLLQLAGVVSGGGQALQRGLEHTQQYMSQSMLLKEREDMERERMRLTFGHDEGMLQKRALLDERAADLAHSRQLDRDEQRQDFEAGENRKSRQVDREKADQQVKAQQERDERQQQNAVTNKVLDASYEQQKDATKQKVDRAKEDRERADKRAELQTQTGARLVEQMLQNQRPYAGWSAGPSGKLDPNVNATLKVYDQELKDLGDELNNVMTKPERATAIQRRMEAIRNEQFKLLGRSRGDSQGQRPPIRFPE